MELGNRGILVIQEKRENLDKMKKFYQEEYRKLVQNEKKNNWNYFVNKWKVRFGTLGCNIGLFFAPKATRTLGRLGVNIGSFIVQKYMKYKNKKENEKLQKKKDELTANFINGEGEFKEFTMDRIMLDIQNIDEKEIGRSK